MLYNIYGRISGQADSVEKPFVVRLLTVNCCLDIYGSVFQFIFLPNSRPLQGSKRNRYDGHMIAL